MGAKVKAASTESEKQSLLIDGISQLFYQSLLCPDNSVYVADTSSLTNAKVNDRCVCKDGYFLSGAACVSSCPAGTYKYFGKCVSVCPAGTKLSDNVCKLDFEKVTEDDVHRRHKSADGTTFCTQDVSDLGASQWAVLFSYGKLYGDAICRNTDGTTTVSDNRYCWCRATGFKPQGEDYIYKLTTNGLVYERESFGSECARVCPYNCASKSGGNMENVEKEILNTIVY